MPDRPESDEDTLFDEGPPFDDEVGSRERRGGEEGGAGRGMVADAVRKAVLAGLGAVFMTEDGARKMAREWKLPKELLNYVMGQAHGAKDEVMRILSAELRRFFESETVRREFLKVLTSMSIEIKAEVRLKEGDGGKIEPSVKGSAAPQIRREEDEE